MLKYSLFFICLFSLSILGCKKDSVTEPIVDPVPGDTSKWALVWADEFNYAGLPDSSKWYFETGGHGWGNNELQYYTSKKLSNCRVEDGNLIIEALKERWENKDYTSARLNSNQSGSFTYGRFEVRAKLPKGRGTWPAIWMLATNWTYGDGGWPDNGEIDIMEHVGYNQGTIHGSVHTRAYYHKIGTQKTGTIRVPDCSEEFHTYILEWSPEKIEMYVDTTKYFTFLNEKTGFQVWPFDKAFHFIFNIAVGGDWGGAQGVDPSVYPQKMWIDWVRVYKENKR